MAVIRKENPSEQVLKDNPHFALCYLTARRFVKEAEIALYEYQSHSSGEHPMVDIQVIGFLQSIIE